MRPIGAQKFRRTVENSVPRTGGRLRRGNPGNSGGRPSSELRAKLIKSALARLPVLERIADDKQASNRDRIQAVKTMLQFGLNDDANVRVSFVRESLAAMAIDLREKLSQFMTLDDVELFINGLSKHWEGNR